MKGNRRNAFGGYHPLLNFGWFCAVIFLSMLLQHPLSMGIATAGSAFYAIWLGGRKTLRFVIGLILPMILLVMVINPLVNHEGVTILTYIGDNPITLEAVLYGIISGCMLASVFLWFSCYNTLMSSDKFVYLFGRILPSMSLVFSMALRFIPRFKVQIQAISRAQKCVGRDVKSGSLLKRAKYGAKILSIMVTWALENAIITADSMKSRGYGLKGRTAFSIYRFDARDAIVGLIVAAALLIVAAGIATGAFHARYFPCLELIGPGSAEGVYYEAWFVLCFLPIMLDIKEAFKWRRLQSEM